MCRHLERVKRNIQEDLVVEGIQGVDITLGRKPPRIYVTREIPIFDTTIEDEREEERIGLLTPQSEMRHRETYLREAEITRRITEIMRKHGLRSYHANPFFKGVDHIVSAYGYEHSQYRIPSKRK